MTKHTPGPWIFDPTESGATTVRSMGGPIALVAQREGLANARLISAAPDLFTALDQLLQGMEASGGWSGDDDLFAAGMAAIRKAEGR